MVKIRDLRKTAAKELELINNESPKADVDCLLSGLLGFSKTEILLGDKMLTDSQLELFESALSRLKNSEPVQYITGKCEFMSLMFEVDASVLIPRSDTEILVEAVIGLCEAIENPHILEIGCGSGCIAVSLAHYLRSARITAVDISTDAIAVAQKNALNNNVSKRIHFLHHDIMNGFPSVSENVDIVVSNPPYIPTADIAHLEIKVRDFEPKTALEGGTDGLDFYRKITDCARLNKAGYLAFEVGISQADAVKQIMSAKYSDIQIIKDINKIDRCVIGKIQNN